MARSEKSEMPWACPRRLSTGDGRPRHKRRLASLWTRATSAGAGAFSRLSVQEVECGLARATRANNANRKRLQTMDMEDGTIWNGHGRLQPKSHEPYLRPRCPGGVARS